MNENFLATQEGLNLSKEDLYRISLNAIEASFISGDRAAEHKTELDAYFRTK